MMISAGLFGPCPQMAMGQAQQQMPVANLNRAVPADIQNMQPGFVWQPPSHLLTKNAANLVANPLVQLPQAKQTVGGQPKIVMMGTPSAAQAQQVTGAKQPAVHFASPIQQLYQLPPSPPSNQDVNPRCNAAEVNCPQQPIVRLLVWVNHHDSIDQLQCNRCKYNNQWIPFLLMCL